MARTMGTAVGIGAAFVTVCAAVVALALTLAVGQAAGGAADKSHRPEPTTNTIIGTDSDTLALAPSSDPLFWSVFHTK